jgi:hypothetical protein
MDGALSAFAEDVGKVHAMLIENKHVAFNVFQSSLRDVTADIQKKKAKTKGKSRGESALDELIGGCCFVFEHLLLHLAAELHNSWKAAEVEGVLGKLLHPLNHPRLLEVGVRCATLWVAILNGHIAAAGWQVFYTLSDLLHASSGLSVSSQFETCLFENTAAAANNEGKVAASLTNTFLAAMTSTVCDTPGVVKEDGTPSDRSSLAFYDTTQFFFLYECWLR